MGKYHKPTNKKVSRGTGGKRRGKQRDKKLAHFGREFTSTRVSEKELKKKVRGRGGTTKTKIKKATYVNVIGKKGTKKAKVISVLESHNPEYVRRNIITRGAILNTELGKVKVTNRVGQDGVVNGILINDKESS